MLPELLGFPRLLFGFASCLRVVAQLFPLVAPVKRRAPSFEPAVAAHAQRVDDAGDGVGEVVVPVRSVVDRILAGAGDAPLKADDLTDRAIVPRQRDASSVQPRQVRA